MFSKFYYDEGKFFISYNSYSDFLSHLPLIRSFSLGENIPPEFPYFPGEPIKYHFFFYFLVGLLEKIGLRIDLALNLLSILGLAGLLIIVFLLARKLSKSYFVAFTSGLLIILNSSLSWIYYFFIGEHKVNGIQGLLQTTELAAFGPYNDSIISAFWNLNIYASQRHLALAMALTFLAIWFIVYKKGYKFFIAAVIIIGLMSWMHKAMLLLLFLSLGIFFVAQPLLRKKLLLAVIIGIIVASPGLIYLSQSNISDASFLNFSPGFLYQSTSWWEMSNIDSGFMKWLVYWVMNVGTIPLLAISGYAVIALDYKNKNGLTKFERLWEKLVNEKTVWFYIATTSFVLANTFSFGKDIANNHKLINFSLIIWGIYAFIFLKQILLNFKSKLKYLLVSVLLLITFAGGVCDLFPVFNDANFPVTDYFGTEKGLWVAENSEPGDIFLNICEDNTFVLLAGRKVFWGGRYFNWSLGYSQDIRDGQIMNIVGSEYDQVKLCEIINDNNIKYVYFNSQEQKLFDLDIQTDKFIEKYGEGLMLNEDVRMYYSKEICN